MQNSTPIGYRHKYVKAKTMKLFEENVRVNPCDFGLVTVPQTAKAKATKEKIDRLDHFKMKNFCASKDT